MFQPKTETIKRYAKYFIAEEIYLFCGFLYLFLNEFLREDLLLSDFDGAKQVLFYRKGLPTISLISGCVLVGVGIFLAVRLYYQDKSEEEARRGLRRRRDIAVGFKFFVGLLLVATVFAVVVSMATGVIYVIIVSVWGFAVAKVLCR